MCGALTLQREETARDSAHLVRILRENPWLYAVQPKWKAGESRVVIKRIDDATDHLLATLSMTQEDEMASTEIQVCSVSVFVHSCVSDEKFATDNVFEVGRGDCESWIVATLRQTNNAPGVDLDSVPIREIAVRWDDGGRIEYPNITVIKLATDAIREGKTLIDVLRDVALLHG